MLTLFIIGLVLIIICLSLGRRNTNCRSSLFDDLEVSCGISAFIILLADLILFCVKYLP